MAPRQQKLLGYLLEAKSGERAHKVNAMMDRRRRAWIREERFLGTRRWGRQLRDGLFRNFGASGNLKRNRARHLGTGVLKGTTRKAARIS